MGTGRPRLPPKGSAPLLLGAALGIVVTLAACEFESDPQRRWFFDFAGQGGSDGGGGGGGPVRPADLAAPVSGPDPRADLTFSPPSCSNGRRDGDESDVDCGGATCGRCAACRTCLSSGDCATGECLAARCGLVRDVTIDWRAHCFGVGGGNALATTGDMPPGTYLVTALGGGGTTWMPTDGKWWWEIHCSNLPVPTLRTPIGQFYPSANQAFAALPVTSVTATYGGGFLHCSLSDNPCDDNQGGVRFRVELLCR